MEQDKCTETVLFGGMQYKARPGTNAAIGDILKDFGRTAVPIGKELDKPEDELLAVIGNLQEIKDTVLTSPLIKYKKAKGLFMAADDRKGLLKTIEKTGDILISGLPETNDTVEPTVEDPEKTENPGKLALADVKPSADKSE